ncbi:hypothetical protein [Flavobacterium suncheonense]|uniref:Uncharacterized protein n=1 Tax=Flavobacterium suncheonense GH29-5 = DSM 17707 TaxID=1121899 RepID=A0A0A2MEA3_9FLAO|nr:hypothetical protein [Flavobacterium suncheonense]KGO89758.1 hypothetical protein Q764_06100 [Flavobacterium suncheonense GH29-5 = DSM 17707]
MKIEIKLSNDQIMAICKLLDLLEHLTPTTKPEDKLIRSIAFEVWDKFQTIKKKLVKSHDLFDSKKKKVTLKYYEAYGLLKIIRETIPLIYDQYNHAILCKLSNELDQKLS